MCKAQLLSSLLLFLSIFYHVTAGKRCNYFVDTFHDSGLYYPTDICNNVYGEVTNTSTMYKCSSDKTYITAISYSRADCNDNNITSSFNVSENEANYEIYCGGISCALQLKEKTYTSSDCSGTAATFAILNWVTNVCYNSSATLSIMYKCTSSNYTLEYYSDQNCKTKESSISYSGCHEETSTSSVKYVVSTCDNPYNTSKTSSSSQIAFSKFVSFVMVAIAFFIC